MNDLLVQITILGLLTAINPVPIGAAIVLLAAPHGKRNAFIFLLSLSAIMAIVGVALLSLGTETASGSDSAPAQGALVFQLLIGLAFLGIFVQQWRRSPDPGGDSTGTQMIERFGLAAPLVMGAALTNYALVTTVVGNILAADVTTTQGYAALAWYILLAATSVLIPLLLTVVRPVWAAKQLGRLNDWLSIHDRVILMVVFGLMGGVFTAQALIDLLA